MQEEPAVDRRAVAPKWLRHGTFVDAFGRQGTVGSACKLLSSTNAFDEKGGRSGNFAVGQEFEIIAISAAEPVLLYIEGVDDAGAWSCGWARPSEVHVVTS